MNYTSSKLSLFLVFVNVLARGSLISSIKSSSLLPPCIKWSITVNILLTFSFHFTFSSRNLTKGFGDGSLISSNSFNEQVNIAILQCRLVLLANNHSNRPHLKLHPQEVCEKKWKMDFVSVTISVFLTS